MQYVDTFLLSGGAPVLAGSDFLIADLVPRLGEADFGPVEYGNEYGSSMFTTVTVVPEPSTLILLAMGALGLLAHGWRRRRS